MSSPFRITAALWDRIHHYASFPQTGVSLQQMILFGQNPSQGTLFKASQFLSEELPIRLAHRAKELDELPHNLHDMQSIKKVKNWYCQSFEELINFPKFALTPELKELLYHHGPSHPSQPSSSPAPSASASSIEEGSSVVLPESIQNPSFLDLSSASNARGVSYDWESGSGAGGYASSSAPTHANGHGHHSNGKGNKLRIPIERRYYAPSPSTSWPPALHDYNARFTRLLENIKRRHDPTVTTVAQGVLEWKKSVKTRHIGLDVQAWLDRFYMSRIGIRFLIGQHVALNTLQPHPDYVGIICTRASVHDIVHEAIENARFVCEEHFGLLRAPPVQLICASDLTFAYVPGHLAHICFELLKNSLRAVVERFGVERGDNISDVGEDGEGGGYPPIKVIVSEGKEDITIKISDEGGGIPRSAIPLIWTYMYTTMEGQGLDQDFRDTDFKAPMAGFGYGLPLSRLYARYFGGDLKLISMEGYGTDVYIHLNRLSSSREPLQ